ncbi:MAG: DUF2510 domain-containing protein [Ilumatobacteraceae bacterium]
MTQAAGWSNDPYGRFQQRYWDGEAWTEHVATNGAASIDPLGDSTVIPFAIPASAFTAPDQPLAAAPDASAASGSARAKTPRGFLDGLGPDARDRPAPRLAPALAGAGGAVVALGIVAGVVGNDGSRARTFAAAIVVLALALAVRLFVKGHVEPRSAAVGAGVIGVFAFGFAIVADDARDAWGILVVGLLFLAAWVLPGFRGRPIMLGIGALLMVFSLGAATGSDDGTNEILADVPFIDVVGGKEAVFLVAAAALLGLVWLLDRAGYRGVGTSLVVAALVSAFVGVAQASSNIGSVGTAVLIFAVGIVVCLVGSHGDRRATTWWGALLVTIGAVAFFAAVMDPDSIGSTAGMLLISGALLIVGPAIVRLIRSSQNRSDPPPSAADTPSTQEVAASPLPPPTP